MRFYYNLSVFFMLICNSIYANSFFDDDAFPFKRGSYQEKYNIKTPWTSKGLSPVKMTFTKNKELEIIKDGKPNCDIVIPIKSQYDNYYKATAKLLKNFLDASCEGTFKIVKGDCKNRGIFIGPCENKIVSELYQNITNMPDESFSVISFNKGILLAGKDAPSPLNQTAIPDIFNVSSVRGSYFAVVDFLERMVGFRFYFPGALGIHIPYYNNQTVSIPFVEYSDKPVYILRKSSHGYAHGVDASLLKANKTQRLSWERVMRSGDVQIQKFGHTDGFWQQKYAKTNPEWFALRKDGTRMIGKRAGHSAHRCYTSEEGFQEHIKLIERAYAGDQSVKPFLRTMPNDKYIYWWGNDGFTGCWCEKCKPFMDMKAPHNRTFSRLHWQYILRLAKVIEEKWPGKILKVPLYHNYAFIPKNIKVPDNVTLSIVRYGEGVFSFAYLKEKKYWDLATEHIDMLNSKSKEKIWIWQHYPLAPRMGTRLQIPYLMPHYLQKFLSINKNKLLGFYLNGEKIISFGLDGIIIYLQFRLMWNPNLDVDAVIDEYSQLLWGPAHKEISDYYKLVINRWENIKWKELPNPPEINQKIKFSAYWKETYPIEIREKLKSFLEQAILKTHKGTIYNERAKYMLAAINPFFEQGYLYDEGVCVRGETIFCTPVIDANLDEWKSVTPFILKDNNTMKSAQFKTIVYVGHDEKNLYIAGKAYDDSSLNTSGSKQSRDFPLWKYDSIEIFLSPAKEGYKEAGLSISDHYYQIIIGPYGTIFDGYKQANSAQFNKEKNLDIKLKTKIVSDGYTFELSIPFKELGTTTPKSGTEWLFNIFRNRHRKDSKGGYAWAPTLGAFNLIDRFGVLKFPNKLLWVKSFNSSNDKFIIERKPNGVNLDVQYKKGKYLLHIKAEDVLPRKEFKLILKDIPPHIADDNITTELKFKFEGEGLNQLRAYGVDKANKIILENYIYTPKGDSSSFGWITPLLKRTKSNKKIKAVNYFCLGIIVNPNADFYLEIDYVKVY